MLTDIAEGLRPETQLRIKNISSIYFDLAVERVCRIIKKVREENHIADREATKAKVHTLIMNMHEDRNSRFDAHSYRGKRLSSYTSPEWIEWVEQCVLSEVYAETVNNGRAYTNVQMVYDRIKNSIFTIKIESRMKDTYRQWAWRKIHPGKRSPEWNFREYAYTREIADEVVRELAKRAM